MDAEHPDDLQDDFDAQAGAAYSANVVKAATARPEQTGKALAAMSDEDFAKIVAARDAAKQTAPKK